MRNVLVTGANGWIGRSLTITLLKGGHRVYGIVRASGQTVAGVEEWLHSQADFENLDVKKLGQQKIEVVVHTAARAHVMDELEADPLSVYRASNVEGTLRVAQAARDSGVKRFIFVSSIKALGESELRGPWREDAVYQTMTELDPYGRSKFEAERLLLNMANATFKIIIIRLPLVYGPGVRANFLKLIEVVDRGWPLPLGCVRAQRSIVALDNLVDAISHCVSAPSHALDTQNIFHVADETALSVRDLILKIASLLGKKPMLFPVPISWLQLLGKVSGRRHQVDRLTHSLRIETSAIKTVLGWLQPLSTDEGLKQTIDWYLTTRKPLHE